MTTKPKNKRGKVKTLTAAHDRGDDQVYELKKENRRLLEYVAMLEAMCTAAHKKIRALETELRPHAPEKLTFDELDAVLSAVLETDLPARRKRR